MKDEGSNLETMAIALKFFINYERLDWRKNFTVLNLGMPCQRHEFNIEDEKFCHGLHETSIKFEPKLTFKEIYIYNLVENTW